MRWTGYVAPPTSRGQNAEYELDPHRQPAHNACGSMARRDGNIYGKGRRSCDEPLQHDNLQTGVPTDLNGKLAHWRRTSMATLRSMRTII